MSISNLSLFTALLNSNIWKYFAGVLEYTVCRRQHKGLDCWKKFVYCEVSFTQSVTSQIQCKRHYNQWHHHLITPASSRPAAGGEEEWLLARLWWRGGVWMLRGVHDYNRAPRCIYPLSLSCWLSFFGPVHFFLLMISFPNWARLLVNSRGREGTGVALFSVLKRKGGGGVE